MGLIKDTFYVMFSNILSIVLNFVYYPILVRLYGFSSDVFGNFQYISSTLGVITAFSVLAMDIAYISERKKHTKKERSDFLTWFLTIGIIIKFSSVSIWAFVTEDKFFFFSGIILGFAQLLSVSIQLLLKDEKKFKILSIMIVFQTIFNVIFGIIFGFFLRNALALVLASTFSCLSSTIFIVIKSNIKVGLKKPNASFLKNFSRNNSNLIIFQTGSNLLNTVSFNLPVFVINILFGEAILGFYSLAYRLVLAVNRVMSQALSQTFLPYFSKSRDDEIKIFGYLNLLAVLFYPLYLFVSLLADIYVPLLFGNSYIQVVDIIKVLIPWLFSIAVISPYTSSFTVHKKANINLVLNILLLGSRIAAMFLGAKFGYIVSLTLFSIISTVFFNFMMIFSFKFAELKFTKSLALMLFLQCFLYLPAIGKMFNVISCIPLFISIVVIVKKRKMIFKILKSFKKQ